MDGSVLQPGGRIVVAVGVASLVGALTLSWRELLVLAVGCAIVLLFALPFIIGQSELRLTRTIQPPRVTVGEPAVSELAVENVSGRLAPAQQIRELIGEHAHMLALTSLSPGDATTVSCPLQTSQRGIYTVGPARISRTDPCRLLRRDAGHTGVDRLWVHPRTVPLSTPAVGLTKEFDGPTSEQSPAGDVAFHAIRPYRHGDDARHVHWLSSARAGELMVRHFVDNRLPELHVLVDVSVASWSDNQSFEMAVEIAASLAVAAASAQHPVSVQAGDSLLAAGRESTSRSALLDDLAGVSRREDSSFEHALAIFTARCPSGATIAIISGTEPTARLSRTLHGLRHNPEVLWITPAPSSSSPAISRSGMIRLIRPESLEHFAKVLHHRQVRS